MSIFDSVKENIEANFSEFVKVVDPKSNWTIEDFPYDTGVDETTTNPHCWRCVTVNQCWFKNEKEKRPEEFDYSNYSFTEIPNSSRGLYHPHCHCRKKSINIPKLKDIELIELREKFNDFFRRKGKIIYSIGYSYKNEKEFIDIYTNKIKESYKFGNYELYKHSKYGFQININLTINGINTYKNRFLNIKSGAMIYPNGKIKLITIFAGRK